MSGITGAFQYALNPIQCVYKANTELPERYIDNYCLRAGLDDSTYQYVPHLLLCHGLVFIVARLIDRLRPVVNILAIAVQFMLINWSYGTYFVGSSDRNTRFSFQSACTFNVEGDAGYVQEISAKCNLLNNNVVFGTYYVLVRWLVVLCLVDAYRVATKLGAGQLIGKPANKQKIEKKYLDVRLLFKRDHYLANDQFRNNKCNCKKNVKPNS